MNTLSEIEVLVNNLRYDIKAEAIVADLMENGLKTEDLVVLFQGSFKRKFEKDVVGAEVLQLNNNRELLGISLTRDGIYDTLPEGMFHEQSMEVVEDSKSMASSSKQQKLEEKGARDLFLPFENEILNQRIHNELQERKILSLFNKNLFDDIMPEFWNLSKNLPKQLVSKLVLMLPMAHKIVGDLILTAQALEVILGEKVQVRMVTDSQLNNEVEEEKGLGEFNLGRDFIVSKPVCQHTFMEFLIGPLQHLDVNDFLDSTDLSRLINCFYDFFVPMELNVRTKIEVPTKQEVFILNDNFSETILGYNTAI